MVVNSLLFNRHRTCKLFALFSFTGSFFLIEKLLLTVLFIELCSTIVLGQIFTNEFAIRINGGTEDANNLAEKHGFINHGQIGSLEGYYLFEHHSVHKRSTESSQLHHHLLRSNPQVMWVEQQYVKRRVKRDLNIDGFRDPLYSEQWYLHGGGRGGFDMNVMSAWKEGYTGKGVVVSILDDGIQSNHPDLVQNYDKKASLDINGKDEDPMPQDNGDNKHGTRCAGEVASVAFNEFCGVGIAYNASIGGVRMLDGSVTDATEAAALSHNPEHIHIYSASWGPEDDGKTVDGPGPLAKHAFAEGISKGRSGLGSLFIWASGNGGRFGDSCNCDGYTNSIYTLSISSATQSGTKPWYLEQCSSTLATTYSSGTLNKDKSIVTVDMDTSYFKDLKRNVRPNPLKLCTRSHTGTSASAPIAAAICALALEANSKLTWRDMQHLVLMTSRPEPLLNEDGWVENGVGRKISSKFGYGLMDASAMVKLAKHWKTVPPQRVCETPPDDDGWVIPNSPNGHLEVNITTDGCKLNENGIIYLEHVQVKVTLYFKPRGNLKMILISPSGTPSTVLLTRPNDIHDGSFNNWPFMSVHFWGEKAEGNWKLVIINEGANDVINPGKLLQWSLVLYGTEIPPVALKQHKRTDEDFYISENVMSKCYSRKEFQAGVGDLRCLQECPTGQYGDLKDYVCHECDKSCITCYGPSYNNCLSCDEKLFLLNNTCVKSCPDGSYGDAAKKECLRCSSSCFNCQWNKVSCTSCKSRMFFYQKDCIANCPMNTYISNGMCERCHSSCATCKGPEESDCITCSEQYYLFGGNCIDICPDGYFKSKNKCYRCHSSCKTCEDGSSCSTCRDDWNLNASGLCTVASKCPSGWYNPDTNTCEKCGKHCKWCSELNHQDCYTCEEGSFWSETEKKCTKSCPVGTYINYGECHECDETCKKCQDGTSEKCISCRSKLFYLNGTCLSVCPPGFYDDGKVCLKCHSTCIQCIGSKINDCTACEPHLFLLDKKCISKCPSGYFSYSSNKISPECILCHHSCKTCIDSGSTNCVACHGNSMFVDGTCIPCLDNQYFDKESQSCQRCHSQCGRCNGPSEDNCLSCQTPYKLDKVNHHCLPCCGDNISKGSKCCACSSSLDVCINSSDHPRSISVVNLDANFKYEVVIPMKHVVPIVIAICASAVLLFVILFGILQATSLGWCRIKFRGKQYERVPSHLAARFDAEMEKVSLTQDDLDEDDDIYEKA